jgi:hypothetical protein
MKSNSWQSVFFKKKKKQARAWKIGMAPFERRLVVLVVSPFPELGSGSENMGGDRSPFPCSPSFFLLPPSCSLESSFWRMFPGMCALLAS